MTKEMQWPGFRSPADKGGCAMVNFRWLGTAGCEISAKGKTILIDPYLSRPSKREIFLGSLTPREDVISRYAESLPAPCAAIIAGHTHFDHALDIPPMAEYCKGPVVGSKSLQTLMGFYGKRESVVVCEGNERIRLSDDMVVTMIPSRHGKVLMGKVPYPGEIRVSAQLPLKAKEYRLGGMFIPHLAVDGISIMHVGSANFIESALERTRCNVLLMCVPGWERVEEYTTSLLHLLKPSCIIPFHFDDFTLPVGDDGQVASFPFLKLKSFVARIRASAPRAVIRIPRPFENIELS